MTKKAKGKSYCGPASEKVGCCKVESIVSVDERGQMVLPKEVRGKAGIAAGDKLALVSWERSNKVCCISLVKAEDFEAMVRSFLGPMAEEIFAK